MPYELNKTDGSLLVSLSDGLIDNFTTSLKFIGKNVFNYGEVQNENFLQLLENFSDNTSPQNPLSGQLWFDSDTNSLRLKLYDGNSWKGIPTIYTGEEPPLHRQGDFWWDTTRNQLFLKTGTDYTLVGPNYIADETVKLSNPVLINGVSFDGSNNITITSNTTYEISPGSYLEGQSFNGSAPQTWNVDVGNVESADSGKIVARNSNGDIWFRVGYGLATSSRYGDLAEKYIADDNYLIGTVVTVGGKFEITQCNYLDRPLGVVSENPGFMMNSELKNGTYIALKGRVKVRVTGEIFKGSKLVAGPKGTAIVGDNDYFAIALENNENRDTVEAVIL